MAAQLSPVHETLHYSFPVLYGKEKSGKTKVWTAQVFVNGNVAVSSVTYGQMDGKMTETRREYTVGKNIGKKNETTPLQQCMAETERKWIDKVEKEAYSESSETRMSSSSSSAPMAPILPMLAQTYDPQANKKKTIIYPCYLQPKIDGLRCLMYYSQHSHSVVCQSRTGGQFSTVDHIADRLRQFLTSHPEWVIDGELYTRTYPFEELAGLIKKVKLSDGDRVRLRVLEYHIYDALNRTRPEMTFEERWQFITAHIPHDDVLIHVPTEVVSTVPEFRARFSEYVTEGWEGVMLRNRDGPYMTNYRSHDLQKYKEMMEEEFPIVGWHEADGRDKGTVIWVCRTADGQEFAVRPRGTLEQRRVWFENAREYLGKLLTVIFQEKSEKMVPRFPVGKAIRDGY